jgi:hypothetical protein
VFNRFGQTYYLLTVVLLQKQTIAHDKGKPVVKQGRKAIESPTGDCQAAEGIEEEPGSASAVCFILFATAAPLLA